MQRDRHRIVIVGAATLDAGSTSMPSTLGFWMEPGKKLRLKVPLVTVTGKVFTTGMFMPPAVA